MKNTSENLEQAAVQRPASTCGRRSALADVAIKRRQTYLRYLEALRTKPTG